MHLSIIAASNRQPEWVEQAYAHYAKRLSGPVRLAYTQVRLSRNANVERRRSQEAEKLLAAVPRGAFIVALDEGGEPWTTRQLSRRLEQWMAQGTRVCFLIGGPDGLAPEVLQAAGLQFSLSALTLPHALARITLAEALYRAFSLLSGHPYHRE